MISRASRLPAPAASIVLLLARLVLGGVLIAHGLQKASLGVEDTTQMFTGMGVPLPALSAAVVMGVELLGGAALLVGAATAAVGLVVAVTMVGAVVFVHPPTVVFVAEGGWELVGVIAAAALALAATGPGLWAVDTLWTQTRYSGPAHPTPEQPPPHQD